MKFRVWYNGGDSSGPHNWRYEPEYYQALVPQDKAMNDEHIAELTTEWLLRHNPPATVLRNPGAMRAWRAAAQAKAREWAIKHEPKRYLNPLLRPMNGIPADRFMRRNKFGNTECFIVPVKPDLIERNKIQMILPPVSNSRLKRRKRKNHLKVGNQHIKNKTVYDQGPEPGY